MIHISKQSLSQKNDPFLQKPICFSINGSVPKNDPFLQKLIQSTKNWSSQPKTDPNIQKPICCVSKNVSVPPKSVVLDPIGAISSFQFLFDRWYGSCFSWKGFHFWTIQRSITTSAFSASNGACNETHTFRHARVQLVAITSLKLYRVFWNIHPNIIMDMTIHMHDRY